VRQIAVSRRGLTQEVLRNQWDRLTPHPLEVEVIEKKIVVRTSTPETPGGGDGHPAGADEKRNSKNEYRGGLRMRQAREKSRSLARRTGAAAEETGGASLDFARDRWPLPCKPVNHFMHSSEKKTGGAWPLPYRPLDHSCAAL
jgi:hypothetical protein